MAEKYLVIAGKLELELKRMRSEGKTKLPSEQDLCKEYSCSRQTVRSALDVLLKKGLIIKRCGAGSFIADEAFSSRTVFFMTEDCDRYQSPALISGIKEQLALKKYQLTAFSTGGSYQTEKQILSRVSEERPAALIIEPCSDLIPDPNTRTVEEINGTGVPVIYCNSYLGEVHVAPDNAEAGRMLTKHLLDTGRKKIGGIFRMDESSGRERYQGYIDALLDAGAVFDESGCLLLTRKEEKDIISGNDRKFSVFVDNDLFGFDAVICQNGMVAHQLVNMLRGRGVSIPEDIAVACFDNSYYSEIGEDGMISAGYDTESMCRLLAKTAVALAEGRSAKSVVVPVMLNNRADS